jgi:hypothetical protein
MNMTMTSVTDGNNLVAFRDVVNSLAVADVPAGATEPAHIAQSLYLEFPRDLTLRRRNYFMNFYR